MEDDEIVEEFASKAKDFEDKPKVYLVELEIVNIDGSEDIKETCVSVCLNKDEKKKYI